MSASLRNVATQDLYTAQTTLNCPGTARLVIQVANAAIYYQRGLSTRPGAPPAWDEEESVLLPSAYGLDRRCDAVRIRSLAPGQPALVSIEAVTAEEVGIA